MIVPTIGYTEIRFSNELEDEQKLILFNLQTFLMTKLEVDAVLDYVVYTTETDSLDIQPLTGSVVSLVVSELSVANKKTVIDALEVCLKLINPIV